MDGGRQETGGTQRADRESLEIAESRMPEDGDVEWDRHGRDPTVVEGYSWSALRLGIDASRLVDSAVLARSSIPVKSTVPLDVALHVITLAPARRVPVDLSWLRRVFVGRALDWSPGTVLPRHVVSDRSTCSTPRSAPTVTAGREVSPWGEHSHRLRSSGSRRGRAVYSQSCYEADRTWSTFASVRAPMNPPMVAATAGRSIPTNAPSDELRTPSAAC